MSSRSWLIAVLTTIIFILVKGYTFNCGDQEEHLPQVYQMINPSLYPKDYFIAAYNQTFSVRHIFVWLIYLFHFIMPVSVTCFLLHILCVTIVAWVIGQMALYFKATQIIADCTASILLVVFNRFTIGGNALLDTQLTAGNLAVALCALAFYFLLKRRWYAVAMFAGLASLFQVLVGLQVVLLTGFIFLVMKNHDPKTPSAIKFSLTYLLFAGAMLFPILYLQLKSGSTDQKNLFYEILYTVRNPNHYLPSAFPVNDYLRFLSLTIIAGLFHFFVDERLKQLWRLMFVIIIGGMLLYTFLLE